MTQLDHQTILNRINIYADSVLKGIDPQKTKISIQLDKLKPVMEEIAEEYHTTVEDIFILYMDLASEVGSKVEENFRVDMEQ